MKAIQITKSKTMWLMMPMVFTTMFATAKHNQFERIVNDNSVSFMGKRFTFVPAQMLGNDTVMMVDPVSGDEQMVVKKSYSSSYISRVNGQEIKSYPEYNQHGERNSQPFAAANDKFSNYLTTQYAQSKWKNIQGIDNIQLNNVVIDNTGKIIFWEVNYITKNNKPLKDVLSNEDKMAIDNWFDEILANAPLQKGVSEVANQTSSIFSYGKIIL